MDLIRRFIDRRGEGDGAGESAVPVWRAFVVAAAALLIGWVLNGAAVEQTARAQRPGWSRDVAVALTDVVADAGEAVWLDRPRALIDDARSADGTGSSGPVVATSVFLPTEDDPAALWVAGDSLVGTYGPALVELATATGVLEARWEVSYSSGLTRPAIFDWPEHLAEELAAHPVEILVFMVGANDAQPIETADGWASFPGEPWSAEYRRRVGATMDLLTSRVATVYWVGQPVARSATQSERIEIMNEIYRSEAAGRGVRYLDSWSLFIDSRGRYADYLPDENGDLRLMRDADGVHLSELGAERLAAATLGFIRQDWVLP